MTLTVPTSPAGLLLVPVRRPADVPQALGWWGPANYDLSGADQSAVLRSWEDRFGAALVGLSFDVMRLAVSDPPTDPAQCDLLAREHYAFCPDNVDQGVGSLEDYTPVVSEDEWWFWWDCRSWSVHGQERLEHAGERLGLLGVHPVAGAADGQLPHAREVAPSSPVVLVERRARTARRAPTAPGRRTASRRPAPRPATR